jgi:hypothetical protein
VYLFKPRRVLKPAQTKKINVNPGLDQDTHDKLYKLAISCNMTKTKMAEKIILNMVNNPDFINYMQDLYNVENHFKVFPTIQGDRVIY